MFALNEVLNLSSDGAALKRFVTREPIYIFSQIKNVKDEEEKEKLNQLLEALRKELPEGFKIGAAVGEGDCFFDSVAQGLNELKDKGLITSSKGFSVKSLRESCKQYAQQVNQSKKSSWLDNTLKGEGEKLCEYIPRIEFTAEDIENANSDSEIKILKLENAIWGRPEVEGKMICEKYGVRVKTIELRDEEVGGLHVTTSEVGKGNNVVHIVNYRNHFIPLLSNIEKDIKRSIKVSREEAYGNMVGSNSNNISQLYISTPLQDIENSPHKQSGHSRSSGKENREIVVSSRKRKRSVADKDSKVPKRVRININVTDNEDSEFSSDLQDTPGQDKLDNTFQTKQCIPHHLIGLMYRLDLSVLCSLRESIYKHKYPSLSLAFGDSEIDKFGNIVLRYKEKSIHIQIENVGTYYIDNDISYARLFTKEKRVFSINNYFDNFVRHLIPKSDSSLNNIECLVIYTDSGLDLTEEKKLKKGQSRNFYPFKFDSINIKGCDTLKDFLFTNDNVQERGFYQFSQDETTREELLKRLEFSSATQKIIKERKLSQEFEKKIKEEFLDKLVFAVNQPNREELNSIIKSEIKKNSKVQDDYIALQERILHDLATSERHKRLGPGVMYEFNLLMLFLHDMFLHKNIFFINFEGKSCDISNDITINYKDRTTYVKAHNADSNIGYSQLFPSRTQERKNKFSINKHFTLFIEELKKDKNIEYFIIYTNADLDLTEEKRLKKGRFKDFYPLKFDSIDIQEKKYEILRDCSCINKNDLYRFAQGETTREKLLSLLKLQHSLQKEKEGRLSDENEKEIKEKFLDRLILAVNQPNREELNSIIRNEIDRSNVQYNYEELHEITLRWLESHELGRARKGIMEEFLEDIKDNRSSYQRIQNRDINEEIKFAKSVVGREGTPAFYQFLVFLVKGEGRKCLEVLKREGINLSSTSSILSGAGANATKAFQGLYDLWFDEQGNKTKYLKTLEEKEINLANVSSILNKARAESAKAFQDLYDLWFDQDREKTQYLIKLEENGVDLVCMSSILSGAGANAAKAFKDLYDLWFDTRGNKTKYLKTLEKERINLVNMSSILHRAGANAAKTFKGLYDLLFNKQGNKAEYLETLEREGINLTNISSVLAGAGANAAKAFEQLYNSFFDEQGNTRQHLKHFIEKKDEEESFTPHNLSGILSGVGVNIKDAFKELHDVCFNDEGERTELLNNFYRVGFRARNLSCMLCGARARASSLLKKLHSVCFNEKREKTKLLDDFYKVGFKPSDLCSMLSAAADSLEKLHDFCFIGETKKYLNHFLREGFTPTDLSRVLHGARANVCFALKDFHDICFCEEGKRTQLLDNFYKKSFRPIDLSNILSLTGNNATPILRNFHKLCFNKENYLNHFLAKKKLFTPQSLSKILEGIGIKICPAFEKLHDLCFDKVGNKTDYLDGLIKNNPPNKILNILYRKVRKGFPTFLDDIPLQQQDISEVEESEMDDPSSPLSDEEENMDLGSQGVEIAENNSPQQSNSRSIKGKAKETSRQIKRGRYSFPSTSTKSVEQGLSTSSFTNANQSENQLPRTGLNNVIVDDQLKKSVSWEC